MDNRDKRLPDRQLHRPLALPKDMHEGIETGHVHLFRYGNRGLVDLEVHRALHTAGSSMTTVDPSVLEAHIASLSHHLLNSGARPVWGLCHGTRQGAEQSWFRQHLGPQARVFGTDNSHDATAYPFNIRWDFHEVDPDWIGRMDLVYSHAWGRAHDLERALLGWASCLAPQGFMLIDHGWTDRPGPALASDRRELTEQELCDLLDRNCAAFGRVVEVIGSGRHQNRPIRTIVFRAHDGSGA